ncbi:MAG: pyridoxal 5'-phosphate synthase glutaminase subunit PdxT, partial [Prevotella sp.]|nr:pyridoxal 5'-phosphate synthase glutaminase subunit PdxT [Prevotella sp.]
IKEVGPDVEVLAEIDGRIVAARQQQQIVTAFHPELDNDTRMHEFFLSQVRN